MPKYSDEDRVLLKQFGTAVRERRESLGLSQEELSEKADLHRTYVSGVEQGRRNLGLLNILRIAEALEVEPAKLLKMG